MVEHNWIDFTMPKADVGFSWCCKCGLLRLEFFGEEDPYEYFISGEEPERSRMGDPRGKSDDPGCK